MLNSASERQLPYGVPLYVLISTSSTTMYVFLRHLAIILISRSAIPIAIISAISTSLFTLSYFFFNPRTLRDAILRISLATCSYVWQSPIHLPPRKATLTCTGWFLFPYQVWTLFTVWQFYCLHHIIVAPASKGCKFLQACWLPIGQRLCGCYRPWASPCRLWIVVPP